MTGPVVFLDPAYAIALASRTDTFHGRAVELSGQIAGRRIRLLTTRMVCAEIGDALAKVRFRGTAAAFLDSLEASPLVDIVPVSEDLYREALSIYRRHADKEWGMTDCVSFAVMRRMRVAEALTADEHFGQAGFAMLLRE